MDKRFTDAYIEELAHKYKTGTLTPEEQADFEAWYQSHRDTEFLHSGANDPEQVKDRMLVNILGETHPMQSRKLRPLWYRIGVAASVLLCCGIGFYFYEQHQKQAGTQIAKQDIAPGRNQATLTLAGGQKIVLTKGLSGKLAQQGNTLIQVNGGNAITYTVGTTENNPTTKVEYNTLTTVRGEQSPYPLVLADGTKVWLDAASSITYPTAFNGNERLVTVTGEAYFEVAHNAAHPFKVKVKDQLIEDIGTAFNINAYDDEPALKTTLIEGSVKISSGGRMVTLTPGQQAAGNALKVEDVDTEGVIAWKNNYFLFEGDNLESIMRKVSRWYDVDVVYQYNGAKTKAFGGTISRYKTVNSVLKKLEMTGAAHFQLNGKTITVTQ